MRLTCDLDEDTDDEDDCLGCDGPPPTEVVRETSADEGTEEGT